MTSDAASDDAARARPLLMHAGYQTSRTATRHALARDEAARDAQLVRIAALAVEDAEIACERQHLIEAAVEADAGAEEAGVARDGLVRDERGRNALVARRALLLCRRALLVRRDRAVRQADAVALRTFVRAARGERRRRAGVAAARWRRGPARSLVHA